MVTLDHLTDEDLLEFIREARRVEKAARPRTSPQLLGEAQRSFRRWLALAGRMVGADLARYRKRAAKSRIRKADPFAASSETWQHLQDELTAVMNDTWSQVHAESFDAAGSEVGIAYSPDQRTSLSPELQATIGDRITGISDTYREQIADAVTTATERGYSTDQLADGVPADDFRGISDILDGWPDRADMIALTETGTAWNLSSLDAYDDSGLVNQVTVFDGPECGWTEHDDPDLADGTTRSTADAAEYPLSHPNCQRAFGPVVEGAPPHRAQGEQGALPPQLGPQAPPDPFEVEARAAAARIFSGASEDEPALTALLRELDGDNLGKLEGLPFRLKADMDRTIDKILTDISTGDSVPEASKVKDALRYTLVNDTDHYWANVQAAAERLEAEGYQPIKWADNWASDLSRDLNTAWRTPDGTRFELQFHTPLSLERKMVAGPDGLPASHKVYEIYRSLAADDPARAELEAQLRAIWRDVPAPDGTPWSPALVSDSVALPLESPAVRYEISLSVLDDPAYLRARAELDAIQDAASSVVDYKIPNQRIVELEAELNDTLFAARQRIEASIEQLSGEDAKAAWSALRSEVDRLSQVIAENTAGIRAGSIDAVTGIRNGVSMALRQNELYDLLTRLQRQVPLEERLLARPAGRSLAAVKQQQLYDALVKLAKAAREELGLESGWTGEVAIGGVPRGFAGVYDWSRAIRITPQAAGYREGDYLSLVMHELFHSLGDISPSALMVSQGWEEGVVEMASKTFAPAIFERAGIPYIAGYPTYEKWTVVLEAARRFVAQSPEQFYGALIRLPATRRGTYVQRAIDAITALNPARTGEADDVKRAMLARLGSWQQ